MKESTVLAVAARKLPPNAGKGRIKGVPNKATTEFRMTVQKLLDENRENVVKWVREIAEGVPAEFDFEGNKIRAELPPDRDKALRHIAQLAEFAAPKLTRTEVTGDGGGALTVVVQRLA